MHLAGLIHELSASELARLIAEKKLSSREATRAYLDRIAQIDPTLRAFNETYETEALDAADAIDRKVSRGNALGPLAGVPMALKDNLCSIQGRTTCSSRMLQNFRSPYDATVVSRLASAGAVILGKTNLDEFAMGSSTENSAFGPTRNPWKTTCVPGGSSGGSAAAVAARLCAAALGSDTGGSIRQPAALCGIVGLKPTYGLVSRYGLVAFASSLDQIGPMTQDVRDAALLLNVIAGPDPKDSTSWPAAAADYLKDLESRPPHVRIGLPKEFFGDGLSNEVAGAIAAAVEYFKQHGAEIIPVSLPHTRYGIAAYYVIAPAEASSNLARYDGVHYGHRTNNARDLFELYSASRAEGFGPEVQRRIMLGTYALSSGYYDAYYLRAQKVRQLIKEDFDRAFESCDVILSPTTPDVAFDLGAKSGDPLAMYLCDVFTVTCNIAGIPGMSIPCGFSASGLPIGMQFLGPVFSESLMLRLARLYEAGHEWNKRIPRPILETASAA